MLRQILIGLPLIAAISACASGPQVTSTKLDTIKEPITGILYALPLARLNLTYKNGKAVTMGAPNYYPDPAARYVAQLNISPAAAEATEIKANDIGLLESLVGDSTDATAEIVTSVVAKIVGIVSISRTDGARILTNRAGGPPLPGTYSFDPFDKTSTDALGITMTFLDKNLNAKLGKRMVRDPCPELASFCIPVLTPVIVDVEWEGATYQFAAVVPDPIRVIGVDVRRAACSQSKNNLTFKNGILKSYKAEKENEIVACLSIPLDVIGAIFAAPFEVFTKNQKLFDAEQKALVAQTNLLKAEAALAVEKAKAAAQPSQ